VRQEGKGGGRREGGTDIDEILSEGGSCSRARLIEEILNPREVEESAGVGPDEAERVKITIGNSLMMTEEDQRREEREGRGGGREGRETGRTHVRYSSRGSSGNLESHRGTE
jgi:hypothetical protein